MKLHWRDLGTPRADRADGKSVELAGFPLTVLPIRCSELRLSSAFSVRLSSLRPE